MSLACTYHTCRYAASRHRFVALATVDAFDSDVPVTLAVMFQDGDFGVSNMEGIIATSIEYTERHVWVLGDRGEVWRLFQGEVDARQQLPDAGVTGRALGQPNELRLIGGRLFVCGYAGQVYAQEGDAWFHLDDGVVEPEATASSLDLNSIDGTAPDDLHVVGSGGAIFRFDGRRWSRVPVLTNAYLFRVRCPARGRTYVVGQKGTFVESDGATWRVEQVPGCAELDLWDVAEYGGDVYVTAITKIMRRRAGVWEEVRHGLPWDEKVDFLRLDVGDGRLWVMGSKRFYAFDGAAWTMLVDPDNG